MRVSPDGFANRNIPEASKRFLIEAGLPKSAAPYLSFTDLADSLRPVWEIWGNPDDWNEADRLRLSRYYVIGSDGNSGNPICIDEADGGNIVTLEHEDWFASVMFVNSSVPQLAEFLLLFNGADTEQQIVVELEQVDSDALKEGCFWRYELDAGVDV
ncbi:MAG: SUKH-4 family immunity protein [Pyrinomonadaceae bacterium]|nr:SUKH-4 family immunity protein [Pyrinomonadaceae bacterium]